MMTERTRTILFWIAYAAIAAAVILLSCGGAFGQACQNCPPGGSCGVQFGVQAWQQPMNQGWSGSGQVGVPKPSNTAYAAQWATCTPRIIYRGMTLAGVLVYKASDFALVVTAAHLYDRGTEGTTEVRLPSGGYRAQVMAVDVSRDVAILMIAVPPEKQILFADGLPAVGEPITLAGYHTGSLRVLRGRVVPGEGTFNDGAALSLYVSAVAAGGDSGGPVADSTGHLIGIVSRASRFDTACAGVDQIRAVLCPVIARFNKPEQPAVPDTPPPIPVPNDPEIPDTSNDQGNLDSSRLDAIEASIAELKVLIAGIEQVPGPPGPPGKDGKDGIDGADGMPGAIPLDAIKRIVADEVQRQLANQPLTVEFGDGNGNTARMVKIDWSRGEAIRIPGVKLLGVDSSGEIKSSAYAPLGEPVGIKANVIERAD